MMRREPKSKMLILFIAILFVANMVTLYLLFANKPVMKERTDRKANTIAFLRDSVGFDSSQLVLYDSLSSRHKRGVKIIFEDMGRRREITFKTLATVGFSDSAIATNAASLSEQQKDIEVTMLHHLKDIRSLCTPAQLVAFDAGFYKLIARRSESKKDSKKEK
ncbi:MAG: hypothetical protein ABIW38_03265 [Ferruginibacter sp.]